MSYLHLLDKEDFTTHIIVIGVQQRPTERSHRLRNVLVGQYYCPITDKIYDSLTRNKTGNYYCAVSSIP